jgi:hypothetical protein
MPADGTKVAVSAEAGSVRTTDGSGATVEV